VCDQLVVGLATSPVSCLVSTIPLPFCRWWTRSGHFIPMYTERYGLTENAGPENDGPKMTPRPGREMEC